MKTWDVLDREDGYVYGTRLVGHPDDWFWEGTSTAADPLSDREVAYCRETGEVVYR